MKSKKAEEYIDKSKHEDYPGGYLCYTLSEENAKKAVEIAEEEIIERAIKAHRFLCPHSTVRDVKMDGTCYMKCKMELPYRKCNNECQFMKEFIDGLG